MPPYGVIFSVSGRLRVWVFDHFKSTRYFKIFNTSNLVLLWKNCSLLPQIGRKHHFPMAQLFCSLYNIFVHFIAKKQQKTKTNKHASMIFFLGKCIIPRFYTWESSAIGFSDILNLIVRFPWRFHLLF